MATAPRHARGGGEVADVSDTASIAKSADIGGAAAAAAAEAAEADDAAEKWSAACLSSAMSAGSGVNSSGTAVPTAK
jgi:hypothetical protein